MARQWIITRDALAEDGTVASIPSCVSPVEEITAFHAQYGRDAVKFRLLDDDGEVYYYGQMSRKMLDGFNPFAPLDWARGDSGCTELQYFDGNKWRTL